MRWCLVRLSIRFLGLRFLESFERPDIRRIGYGLVPVREVIGGSGERLERPIVAGFVEPDFYDFFGLVLADYQADIGRRGDALRALRRRDLDTPRTRESCQDSHATSRHFCCMFGP